MKRGRWKGSCPPTILGRNGPGGRGPGTADSRLLQNCDASAIDKKTKSAGTEAAGHRSIESLAERVRAGAGLVVVVGSRSKTARMYYKWQFLRAGVIADSHNTMLNRCIFDRHCHL